MPFDERLDRIAQPAADAITSVVFYKVHAFGADWPLVVVWLVAGAAFFTLAFLGINLWGLPLGLRVTAGQFDEPDAPGEITHFQALTTALSGTVGIGNIGGVAVAIAAGGPGVVFWMVLAGVLGMATKFVECTLGVRYREHLPDGSVSGGPMHYLEKGLAELGVPRLGKAIGGFYALGIVIGCLGIGNMFQANQAAVQLQAITGGPQGALAGYGWVVGLVLAVIVGAVILGGVKTIAKVTDKLVPVMGTSYILAALALVLSQHEVIQPVLVRIWTEAFTPEGIAGGGVGVMIIGFQRAVFSNEAGIGSASIAHSAVKTNHPATEGLVALMGPFFDTVIVCTLTALVILTTAESVPGFMDTDLEGVAMTSHAFAQTAPSAPYPIAVVALLFAVSTMIAWAYYGLKGWTYLVGEGKRAQQIYSAVFCLFIVVGAAIKLDAVLEISDALVFLLCVPNVLGLILLTPTVWRELRSFLAVVREARSTR